MNRRRMVALGMMEGGADPFAYRASWLHTIYVATTGNDTTGNGTKVNPYKTFTKAMTVAVAGDGILAADGTYAENTGSGGSWTIDKSLASWLVIEPELGASGNVTVLGVSAAFSIVFGYTASAYLKFRYLTFTGAAGSSTIIRTQSTLSNIYFDNCRFIPVTNMSIGYNNTSTTSNITFNSCYFGSNNVAFVGAGGTPMGLSFINCTNVSPVGYNFTTATSTHTTVISGGSIMSTGWSINGNGGTYIIDGVSIQNTGDFSTVVFGVDGVTGNTTVPTIINCAIVHDPTKTGHVLLFGAGCNGGGANNVRINASYDYSIVVKECTGVEIQNCGIVGGSSAALYFKAATSPNAHDNVLTVVAGYGFQLLRNEISPNNKCSLWQLQNNILNVSGTGKALNIGTSAVDDAGGGICDYNTYQNNSGLGTVRSDSNVANLAELTAAWADYDVTTNDSHSTVV